MPRRAKTASEGPARRAADAMRFRAPGVALSAGELLSRVLPEPPDERAPALHLSLARVARHDVWERGAPLDPGARIAPGTALWLDHAPPLPSLTVATKLSKSLMIATLTALSLNFISISAFRF